MAKGDIMQWLAQHLVPWANKYQENSKAGAANPAAYSEDMGVQAANTGCGQWTRKCSFSIEKATAMSPLMRQETQDARSTWLWCVKENSEIQQNITTITFKKLLWAKLCTNKNLYTKVLGLSILVDCVWRWGLWQCSTGEGRVSFL